MDQVLSSSKIQRRMPRRLGPQDASGDDSAQELGEFLRPLISSFVACLGYKMAPTIGNDTFWAAVNQQAGKTGVPYPENSHSHRCFQVGSTYAIICFPNHPLDVQVYVAIYTWLAIVMDDEISRCPADFERFHECFAAGKPQPTPLLESWAELMRTAFDYWDPVVAGFIVSASLNYVNANIMEGRSDFQCLTPTKGGQSWPWYLREKDGVAEAYAYFTFAKALCPDISCFLEAVPDLTMYIALMNDILSFYKEERAGEKHNYLHNRARYENKDVRRVLKDVITEARDIARRMRLVVEGRQPYAQALDNHILGYISFHTLNDRYRLWEVGLGEEGQLE
ncbi:isoprenoid synthase domain-containing protein [Xylariaceae sp. FL0662B]|nr:isoprenoid synthase domain-containing protein [Xylariaceae sp. FL0662B]